MKLDTGTVITIAAVLLFYLRLIVIQRARIKKAKYQYASVVAKNSKKKKNNQVDPEVKYARLGIQIKNWWMVAGALVLITFGAVVTATQFLGPALSAFWWTPTVLGIGIFALAVK